MGKDSSNELGPINRLMTFLRTGLKMLSVPSNWEGLTCSLANASIAPC